MDQHYNSQHCHEQAEELQSERVTPHGPCVPLPPMLHIAMASIRRTRECHFVSAGHDRIQLASTSFLQVHLQNCTKSQKVTRTSQLLH